MYPFPEVIGICLRGMQMNKFIFSSYVFSCQEFMVLSALNGIRKMDILMEEKEGELSPKTVNLILFQLYQKGIMSWKDEASYTLKPEIRSLFLDMREAKKEIQIYGKNRKSPLLCYMGENLAVTELSENDREAIKIHSVSRGDFLEELRERGLVPKQRSVAPADSELAPELLVLIQKRCADFRKGESLQVEKLQEVLEKEDWLSTLFLIGDSGEEQEKKAVLILDCGLWDCVVYMEKERFRAEYYSAESLRSILQL